jgi:hypothetical protein
MARQASDFRNIVVINKDSFTIDIVKIFNIPDSCSDIEETSDKKLLKEIKELNNIKNKIIYMNRSKEPCKYYIVHNFESYVTNDNKHYTLPD